MRAMRLTRAAELLSGSALAVKEIRAQVGYGDPSNFTKDFAREYGAPPARYRRCAAGDD
jgi:transcriptional regulator GlxA family with amidase domain